MKQILTFPLLFLFSFAGAFAGQTIAFERGDGVWIANLDGSSPKKIASGALPDISADGKRIAFKDEFLCVIQKEHENEPSVYRMSLDGKNAKLVAKHARTPSASAP